MSKLETYLKTFRQIFFVRYLKICIYESTEQNRNLNAKAYIIFHTNKQFCNAYYYRAVVTICPFIFTNYCQVYPVVSCYHLEYGRKIMRQRQNLQGFSKPVICKLLFQLERSAFRRQFQYRGTFSSPTSSMTIT